MPSWDDGEFSEPELLGDFVDRDFAPDTCEDPDFHGLAVGCPQLCRRHHLEPQKCVAFGGSNTGRRFYMCSMENEVNNCGFVSWLDAEWPETLKNAIGRLWAMYDETNCVLIDEKIQNGGMMKKLADEKNKAEKDYSSLLAEVKKLIDETGIKVQKENYCRIIQNSVDDLGKLEKEVEVLKNEVLELKNVQRTQADVMKAKEKQWAEEKEALKEEKKKLEYMLFDLLQVSEANKEKVKRIKAVCDE